MHRRFPRVYPCAWLIEYNYRERWLAQNKYTRIPKSPFQNEHSKKCRCRKLKQNLSWLADFRLNGKWQKHAPANFEILAKHNMSPEFLYKPPFEKSSRLEVYTTSTTRTNLELVVVCLFPTLRGISRRHNVPFHSCMLILDRVNIGDWLQRADQSVWPIYFPKKRILLQEPRPTRQFPNRHQLKLLASVVGMVGLHRNVRKRCENS